MATLGQVVTSALVLKSGRGEAAEMAGALLRRVDAAAGGR